MDQLLKSFPFQSAGKYDRTQFPTVDRTAAAQDLRTKSRDDLSVDRRIFTQCFMRDTIATERFRAERFAERKHRAFAAAESAGETDSYFFTFGQHRVNSNKTNHKFQIKTNRQ